MTGFEDLRIWQESRRACQTISEFIKKTDFAKDFSLKDQIRRSSGSCMDNPNLELRIDNKKSK